MKREKNILEGAFGKLKAYYQYVISGALLLLLFLIVYGHDLEILANEALQNEALSHVLLIPLFAGILFYMKKDSVKASLALEKYQKETKTKYVDTIIGASICLIAFLIYWYGSHTFYPLEIHILSLPIFLLGTVLVLSNLKVLMTLLLPILFLLFIIPIPSQYMFAVGGAMGNLNTQASYNLLKLFNMPVTLSPTYGPPTLILTSSMGQPATFTIDIPCSGIYSLIAFAMFAAFLAFVTRASPVKKLAVVLIGFMIFEILNIIRITAIISIAYWFGEEIAMNLFHAVAGLILIFIGMLITLFTADKFLKIQILPKTQEPPSCPKCPDNVKNRESFCLNCGKYLKLPRLEFSRTFWTKILLLLIGCSILTLSINAPTFALTAAPEGVTSTSNWEDATRVFPSYILADSTNYSLRFLYRDINYEKVAQQDASLMYGYWSNESSPTVVYVAVGIASSISNLHNWEVCLVSWQIAQGQYPTITVLDQRDINLMQNSNLIARYLVFNSPQNYTQTTLYWYEQTTFTTGITVEQKYVRISLIMLTRTPANYSAYETRLLTLGNAIASYWQPLKTESLISLGVPAQQVLLAVSIAFVAFTKTAQYSNDWRKKSNTSKIFNRFASHKEKITLETIQELAKNRKPMETRDISEAITAKTRKQVIPETLFNLLNHLEEHGFIKKDVITTDNQPRLIWKAKY